MSAVEDKFKKWQRQHGQEVIIVKRKPIVAPEPPKLPPPHQPPQREPPPRLLPPLQPAKLEPPKPVVTPEPPKLQTPAVFSAAHGDIIDLPRRCAVHKGQIWIARYVLTFGEWKYVGSIIPEYAQQNQYAPEDKHSLPPEFRTEREKCPCCLIWTRDGSTGSVYCPRCDCMVCYGRTTATDYFFCWCRGEGQLVPSNINHMGVIPKRGGGSARLL